MKSFFSPRKLQIVSLITLVITAVLTSCNAWAHSFIIKPVRNTVAVGGATDIWVTLSEPFATPDLSLYGFGASIDAQLVYSNGKREPITEFSYFNSKNMSDSNPADSDAQKTNVLVSYPGTIIASSKLTMRMPKDVDPQQSHLVSFAKNALNTIADGAAMKPAGDGSVLEIIPMQDLNGITVDTPFKVKVLFKGQPLSNTIVNAVYDGMPLDTSGGTPEQAFAEHDTTDENGIAAITPSRAAFWLLSAANIVEEGGEPYIYQGTLVIAVNGREGETERVVSDIVMKADDNAAGLSFAEFVEGELPEADAFLNENNLRWSAYLSTGNGSSSLYAGGKDQLEGGSGVVFTIETASASGPDAFTGFSSIYAFTPERLGDSAYEKMKDKLNSMPSIDYGENGTMVVASPRDLFPPLGLSIIQVYDDGRERDVTDVMVDIGFEISKIDEGEITAYWGALVADREASDSGYNIPIVLSTIGEEGHILFDGSRDGRLKGIFYISQKKTEAYGSSSGSSGCDTGGILAFMLAGLAVAATLMRTKRRSS